MHYWSLIWCFHLEQASYTSNIRIIIIKNEKQCVQPQPQPLHSEDRVSRPSTARAVWPAHVEQHHWPAAPHNWPTAHSIQQHPNHLRIMVTGLEMIRLGEGVTFSRLLDLPGPQAVYPQKTWVISVIAHTIDLLKFTLFIYFIPVFGSPTAPRAFELLTRFKRSQFSLFGGSVSS